MTTTEKQTGIGSEQIIELAPSYKIPIFLILVAIPLALLNIVVGIVVLILGLFLMFQTVNIRLQFTSTALDLYNSGTIIRHFPYNEWSNWRIFWQPVPILFYFREVNSIHFLPVLFDPKTLVSCLEKYCPKV
ncbi:conserved hypothetical protein [Hyella patelloides LEGE 07179]|uniref:Glycerol dehydrogenase n=1 Tax=Hyella patelloides LEGE 07179 TaxID=945734 RepID=A0A563W0E1_9CYAN|nr:DUF3119 family protein [Hyella patelloides]VEP17182.1 conserved hypothetical protein [Hyella patelloides LEGE 07179]